MTDGLERQTPYNAEAERAILGGIIIHPELIDQCRRLIDVNWFFLEAYRYVYAAMLILDDERIGIDSISLGNLLTKRGQLVKVGGMVGIMELIHGLPHSTNLGHYIEIIRKYAKARWTIRYAEKLIEQLLDNSDDPDEIVAVAAQELEATKKEDLQIRRPRSLSELYDDYALRLMLFHKGISNAIPTGFQQIDEKLLGGGLVPGFTYVIAGRPSMGKSTLALDMCVNAADTGNCTVYVTREMPKESLMDRLVAAKANVSRFKISSGISQDNYERTLEAAQLLKLLPLILDDYSETVGQLDHYLSQMEKLGKRVDLICIDYLQLMQGSMKDGRTNEVSEISRDLKGLAMRHEIPVIEVSQLTRAPGKEHRAPELFDLRESGQIEQDADVVLMLHGDDAEEGVAFYERELLCRKQREGPLFHRLLDMNASLVTFRTPQMLGHGDTTRQRPGAITSENKDVRYREKRTIRQEDRALKLEAEDRTADKFDF